MASSLPPAAALALTGRTLVPTSERDFMPYQGRRRFFSGAFKVVSVVPDHPVSGDGPVFSWSKPGDHEKDYSRLQQKLTERYSARDVRRHTSANEPILSKLRRTLIYRQAAASASWMKVP
jgi:hypothetical protein